MHKYAQLCMIDVIITDYVNCCRLQYPQEMAVYISVNEQTTFQDFVCKQDRPFVLMFLHTFRLIRRSGSVDEIKKCCRDITQDL